MTTETNQKPIVVFVHGGQGCGKSTVTNVLREQWTHTVLMRLAGVPSTQENPQAKSRRYHYEMMQAVYQCGVAQTGMSFVFDRSFLCEKIYANLGFKEYSFEEETQFLKEEGLEPLLEHYRVYMILLTANEETLTKRLCRGDKPQFEQVEFKAKNSLAQQQEYLKEFEKLPAGVETFIVATDGLTGKESAARVMSLIKK